MALDADARSDVRREDRSGPVDNPDAERACGRETAHLRADESHLAAYTSGHEPGGPTDGSVLRPRQDDHREVEHACLQPRVPGRRPDLARGGAALGVRPVRLPRRRRRPRPDGEDAAVHVAAVRRAGTSQTVKEIVGDTLHNIVDPLVYDEAVSLIEDHHLAGRDVIIVSTSGSEVVEPIGEMLGADKVVATRMEVADGKYTGGITFYAYAENKATAIRELADEARLRPRALLRLQRLGHRRAHARGGRPPARGQPRQGPATDRARPRLARSSSSTSRSRCAAGCASHRPSRPSPHSRSAGSRRSARPSGWALRQASRHSLKSQGLCCLGPRRTKEATTPETHTAAGTHAAIYPSYRALVRPGSAGGHS